MRDCDVNRLEDDVDSFQQQLAGTQSLLKEKEGQITDVQESLEQAKVSIPTSTSTCTLPHQHTETHPPTHTLARYFPMTLIQIE